MNLFVKNQISQLDAYLVRVPSDSLQMGGTLSDVAQSLAQKTALLDPEQLAQADARLSALVERFQQVPESLQSLPDMRRVRPHFLDPFIHVLLRQKLHLCHRTPKFFE